MDSCELDTIRGIVLRELAGQKLRVYLFGSQARGSAGAHSDVDLALDHDGPLPVGLLPTLRERLEEAPILARVDVVDLAEASPGLRAAVFREGRQWIAS